jgi:hypothetical protein
MGLDQYAYALDDEPAGAVDFAMPSVSGRAWRAILKAPDLATGDRILSREEALIGRVTLAKWRKHPNLHGFIRGIYTRKGGRHLQDGEFVGPVLLDLADIDAIETATRAGTLPFTEGFLFGVSGPEHDARTLAFCAKAREAIAAGKFIAYDSSW